MGIAVRELQKRRDAVPADASLKIEEYVDVRFIP